MTFTPRTWVVGEVVSAAIMNQEVRDQFNSMFAVWTSFPPVWTAATTNPVLGNGTLTGRYMKIGRTVVCHINLTTGSTTTYGSGTYSFTLPVTSANAGTSMVGNVHLLGTSRWGGQVIISPNATGLGAFFPTYPSSVADTRLSNFTGTAPETLAANAQIRITFVYEAAT